MKCSQKCRAFIKILQINAKVSIVYKFKIHIFADNLTMKTLNSYWLLCSNHVCTQWYAKRMFQSRCVCEFWTYRWPSKVTVERTFYQNQRTATVIHQVVSCQSKSEWHTMWPITCYKYDIDKKFIKFLKNEYSRQFSKFKWYLIAGFSNNCWRNELLFRYCHTDF